MKDHLIQFTLVLLVFFSCSAEKKTDYEFNLIPVMSGEKWGYIDKSGKYIVNPQFDAATCFAEGLACVKVGDKWGYIDEEGKFAINPTYKNATFFKDGLACVVIENGHPSYINKDGEITISLNNAEYATVFHEGLAMVKIKGKYGFIDKTGSLVIQPQYTTIGHFSEGMAVFSPPDQKEILYGYINNKGEIVIKPQFQDAADFKDGLAVIKMNDKYGYIDKEGKIIINPQFDHADNFLKIEQ